MSEKTEVFIKDAARTAPVFNYARFWDWWLFVEVIARAFEQADENVGSRVPVNRGEWLLPEDRRTAVRRENRTGTIGQVQVYCGFPVKGEEDPARPVLSGVWKRIFIASVFALGLQWGTTGSAVMVMVLTPTTGLGCRSGAYILYGAASTTIWSALLLSSYLAHFAKVWCGDNCPRPGFNSANVAKGLATLLRRLSILAAGCNTIWIILACVLQFSGLYNTCYCNSSVLGRGSQRAYNIIAADYHIDMRAAWIGGFVLTGGCAVLYLFFLHLMLEPANDIRDR